MAVNRAYPPRNSVGAAIFDAAFSNPDFAVRLRAVDEEGHQVVVPATGDDAVVDVTELVRQAGGHATVVALLRRADGSRGFRLKFADMQVGDDSEADGDHDVPVSDTCTVEDLFKTVPLGSSITYRITSGEEFSLDEISEEDAPQDFVPAS